jgi:hypothetical protein
VSLQLRDGSTNMLDPKQKIRTSPWETEAFMTPARIAATAKIQRDDVSNAVSRVGCNVMINMGTISDSPDWLKRTLTTTKRTRRLTMAMTDH